MFYDELKEKAEFELICTRLEDKPIQMDKRTSVLVIYNDEAHYVLSTKKVGRTVLDLRHFLMYARKNPGFRLNLSGDLMSSTTAHFPPELHKAISGFLATYRDTPLRVACIGQYNNYRNKHSRAIKAMCHSQWHAFKHKLTQDWTFNSITL